MAETKRLEVATANADAAQAWDGNDGDYWAANDARFDASMQHYDPHLSAAAAISPADRVLDIGCGTGQTTREAARLASDGDALGIDLSSRMLAQAREHAFREGLPNAHFEQADAQIHPFPADAFDIALSRTGTMFFADRGEAFANIARALRSGGRLAVLVWQALEKNHWIRDFRAALADGRDLATPPPDAPSPFSMADPERVKPILADAGFADISFEAHEEPLFFGRDVERAYPFVRDLGFSQFLLRDLDDAGRARALEALRATVTAHATADGVCYPSAAWIIVARRT